MTSESEQLGQRLASVETEVKGMRRDVSALERSLNGPLDGRSVRERLHALENSEAATKAAEAALGAVRVMRNESWSAFQKTLVTGAALVAAAVSIYNAIGG